MEIREIFARNLRKIRQEKGLSQEALAHEAGLDRTYVGSLERSVYYASLRTIEKLSAVLDVEAAAFLERPQRSNRRKQSMDRTRAD
jgi:transcriptional regulator with XRE-family HTH domain